MSTGALDRLLAVLLVALLASGLLTLRSGVPATAPLYWLHGMLGGALLVASVEKLRRSAPAAIRARRWRRLALAALVTLFTAGALVGGFAWAASGRLLSIGPWTVLTLHVWAALALVPMLVLHLLPRRWRVLRAPAAGPRLSRRTLLATGAVAALGTLAWGAAGLLDLVQGGVRRFTGSRWLPEGEIPPPTTFYGEPAPAIDTDAWRLRVMGRVERTLELDAAALAALGTVDVDATLDCTSGWAMRTRWRGTPLAAVLREAGATPPTSHVRVRSVTGWLVDLAPHELEGALLATEVAGQPLPRANGAPCRLVAPDRRGLDWIKWVATIEVA